VTAEASAGDLQTLIDDVPALATGRTAVGASDSLGQQLGALDPIDDPQGGYLGVYHSPYLSRFGPTFRVSLAHSDDLLHWSIVRVLDPYGASMPTLQPIPGSDGYLLAYEKAVPGGDVIRIAYYASRDDLVNGVPSAQRNLPRLLSPYNDGTPAILAVDWQGSPANSLIAIGFHYETSVRYRPAGDREAVGVLGGFRIWRAYRDVQADRALTARGLRGSHGDWRRFSFEGFGWRAYEAETRYGSFANWRLALYDPSSRRAYPLSLHVGGSHLISVGNPIVKLLTAPGGSGQVLAVTAFVFDATDPSLTGELVYYQPTQ
jgi:hypothetical protein